MKKPGTSRSKKKTNTARDLATMSAAELAEATKEFDQEFIRDTFRPLSPASRRKWNLAVAADRRRAARRHDDREDVIFLPVRVAPEIVGYAKKAATQAGTTLSQAMGDHLVALAKRAKKAS
jgi:hypothetical protein